MPTQVAKHDALSLQMAGAFGEKSVEAELLRYGWMPANVNATVKNAAHFDIYAKKHARTVHLRIKACRPNRGGFRWGFTPNQDIQVDGIESTDFTILVEIGEARSGDRFFVVPTRVLREHLHAYRSKYMETKKRDGQRRKDPGNWTLRLGEDKSGNDRPDRGFETKWARYLGAWEQLEG